jgi:hypothetical protein
VQKDYLLLKIPATLLAKWEEKLKKSGFVGIEKTVNGKRVLMTEKNPYKSSHGVAISSEVADSKAEYYRQLGQKLEAYTFDNMTDLYIMTAHSNGVTISNIAATVNKNRKTVRFVIQKYITLWGIRNWTRSK